MASFWAAIPDALKGHAPVVDLFHMERSRMILLASLGALTVATVSTAAWMASASNDGSSASVGTEPTVTAADTNWRPDPAPRPVQLDPIVEVVRVAPKAIEPKIDEAPDPEPTASKVKQGTLIIELRGIRALHDEAVGPGKVAGPITATLSNPSGRGAEAFAKLAAKGMFEGDRVAFEDVPLGLECGLTVIYGAQEDPRTLDLRVGGARSNGHLTVDLTAKRNAENAAIGTLRTFAAAQQQLQASAAIDTDADGGGEFGYLAELAGTAGIRNHMGKGVAPAASNIRLDPAYLPGSFGELTPVASGAALIRGGYAFQIYLPGEEAQRPVRGIPEDPSGGASLDMPGSGNAEIMWCAYAWPIDRHDAPWPTYFINQAGDVIRTNGATVQRYSGLHGGPAFDAAFSTAGDMASEIGLAANGFAASDGNAWSNL